MESFGDAVTASGTGVILSLDVSPGRSGAGFITGYDPWRKAIRCAVRSPALKGRANREVMESVAAALGVPVSSVEILSGATQSRKRVRVAGITRDAVLGTLGRLF